jgi:uncharacterized membrane protein YdjX (TVP38/TMEM64 family)
MTQSFLQALLRRLPLIVVALAAILGVTFFGHYLNFHTLERNRQHLLDMRDQHYALTSIAFIAIYTLVVITSIPGSLILTMTGGFLFGMFPGVLYNVVAAWMGAVIVFLAARTSLGHEIAARIAARGGSAGRLQTALIEHEWSVLFSMRLIPVLPFFITNLVPAFVGVGFTAFAVTTAIGIIPGDIIYTALGDGLGEVFDAGEVPHLDIILQPKFFYPLLGLGVLSLLPFLLRLIRRSRP